jgi:hypothetical protein
MKNELPSYVKADAITASRILILKHVTYLRLTNQIRTLFYYALSEHKVLHLIIPTYTELSSELKYFIRKHSINFKIHKEA